MVLDMEYRIEGLEQLCFADREIWGNKAAYLSDGKKRGLPVKDGFCIILKENALDGETEDFQRQLREEFWNLKKRTGAVQLIARSSAQLEDQKEHIFPGIYRSRMGISNPEELLEAIHLCYNSFHTETAKLYMKNMGITKETQEFFCILVQEQIEPEYSGVAFTKVPMKGYHETNSYYVELVKGHCQAMIQGKKRSNAYLVEKFQGKFQSRRLSEAVRICPEVEWEVLRKLRGILEQAVYLYGPNLDLEWGYRSGEIIIFQIRPVHQQEEKGKKASSVVQIGMKAEAMKKFYDMGLFQKKLLILNPNKDREALMNAIRKNEEMDGPITVRYSWNQELGLPRYFAKDKRDAEAFIRKTYHSSWTVILHESITVRDSYELYLDHEKAILEHMPGMWETDSKAATDIWIYRGRKVSAFAANGVRVAKYEDMIAEEYLTVEPYQEIEIKEIARKIYPYIWKLRDKWSMEEGINFHFVSDDQGRFFFLNHREIGRIENWEDTEERVTVIEAPEDLSQWDGNGVLLLKINLKRGEEILLKEYVPLLKNTGAKVYVQFGILSHPAILLREMGIQVYPQYALHKKYQFEICEE